MTLPPRLTQWRKWRLNIRHSPPCSLLLDVARSTVSTKLSAELEHASVGVIHEVYDCRIASAQGALQIAGGAVAKADPDHLGREATENAHIAEISIFGDNGVVMRLGIRPDIHISRAIQPGMYGVTGMWIEVRQQTHQ